jgi:hypothetical protein
VTLRCHEALNDLTTLSSSTSQEESANVAQCVGDDSATDFARDILMKLIRAYNGIVCLNIIFHRTLNSHFILVSQYDPFHIACQNITLH